MTDIKWQEPPAHGNSRARGKWGPVTDELRAHPGRWALIMESVGSSRLTAVKTGVLVDFRPMGAFEARSVSRADGKFDIYARFVDEVAS